MNKETQTFSISQASEMTGISKNRIREWHAKGFLPGIQLISVGSRLHRRFSEKDIALIEINEYQNQGYLLTAAVDLPGRRSREVRYENRTNKRLGISCPSPPPSG